MNNKVGLKNLFEHKEALTLLARYVQTSLHYDFLQSCIMISYILALWFLTFLHYDFLHSACLQVNNTHPPSGHAGGSQADGRRLLGEDF